MDKKCECVHEFREGHGATGACPVHGGWLKPPAPIAEEKETQFPGEAKPSIDKAQVRRWTLHFWKVSGGGTEITARGPWTPPLSTEPDIAVVPAADYDALAVALERALIDEQEATHDYHARGHLLDAVIAERDALRERLEKARKLVADINDVNFDWIDNGALLARVYDFLKETPMTKDAKRLGEPKASTKRPAAKRVSTPGSKAARKAREWWLHFVDVPIGKSLVPVVMDAADHSYICSRSGKCEEIHVREVLPRKAARRKAKR